SAPCRSRHQIAPQCAFPYSCVRRTGFARTATTASPLARTPRLLVPCNPPRQPSSCRRRSFSGRCRIMAVSIKTAEEIEKMRIAGRLGGEVLDFITPHVKPGVSTAELDRLCHEYMVDVQGTIPAPLHYAPPGYPPYPKSICT